MVRIQIQFTEDQAERLKCLAAQRGKSVAAVVRQAVETSAEQDDRAQKHTRALAALEDLPAGSGLGDVAQRHDEYLAEDLWREHRSSR